MELPNIILGDFNMVEDIKMDRYGGNPREKHTWGLATLNTLKRETNVVDIWRQLYPKRKEFTWHSLYDNVQSRLDRIYLSKEIVPLVNDVEIETFSISDHDLVAIDMTPPEPPTPRGPGYWKMNNSLLKNEEFKELIKNFWVAWRERKNEYANLLIWWDLGKYFLRETIISYSRQKAKANNVCRKQLVQRIQNLKAEDPPNVELLRELREELHTQDRQKSNKIFIATKLEAIEKDEKPTKFFYEKTIRTMFLGGIDPQP